MTKYLKKTQNNKSQDCLYHTHIDTDSEREGQGEREREKEKQRERERENRNTLLPVKDLLLGC